MTKIRYYTSEALEQLRNSIDDNLDWYYAPNGVLPAALSPTGVREANLPAPTLVGSLNVDDKQPHASDVENSLLVFNEMSQLTPHQASIERMWVYICHCECPKYVATRWLNQRPEDSAEAARKVRNHFFAGGSRALIRDNGVSRLWWLGKTATDVAPEDPREFLTILLYRQDVRSALIERPSISMNRRLLRGIYKIMKEQWHGEKKLFERKKFRTWMVALNRRGGVVLLDALPDETLMSLLREEAEQAME